MRLGAWDEVDEPPDEDPDRRVHHLAHRGMRERHHARANLQV